MIPAHRLLILSSSCWLLCVAPLFAQSPSDAEVQAIATKLKTLESALIELRKSPAAEKWIPDVEIHASAHDEFALAREGGYAVALDTALDDGLRREGLARELVRTVNDHRKALGLELSDRIRVELFAAGERAAAAREHGAWIAGEVLATDWAVSTDDLPVGDGAARLTVGSHVLTLRVTKI